jgi:hypothetical protein
MPRRIFLCTLLTFCMIGLLLPVCPGKLYSSDSADSRYEVLSPWAESYSEKLTGISPRLDTLEEKKIGLFANYKHSAIPIALSLKEWLGSMYPDAKINIYNSNQQKAREVDTKRSETFKGWAKGNDAVILLVGS